MPYIPKAIVFSLIAVSIAFFLNREGERGSFAPVDREYISWLMANSDFEIQEPSVTFLQIDDPQAAVFSAWPLRSVDFSILLDNLGKNDPKVIAVEPVLGWMGSEDPLLVRSLQNVLIRMEPNKVLLGAVLQENPAGAPINQTTLSLFPQINSVEGERSRIPEFTNAASLPEPALTSIGAHLGFTRIDLGDEVAERARDSLSVPMLARHGDRVVPSFILMAMLLEAGVSIETVEVELGEAIRFGGDASLEIPIDLAGRLNVFTRIREQIAKANADILILDGHDDIRDQISPEDKQSLQSRIVILGLDDEASRKIDLGGGTMISLGELYAMAMATIQAERYIQKVAPEVKYAIWGGLALAGLLLLRCHRKGKAWMLWLVTLILYITGSLIFFQYTRQWTPLTVPIGIIAAALIVLLILPAERTADAGLT